MKTGFILCIAVAFLAAFSEARLAEKVSEDDDFVVYRIPVRSLDLQPQAAGYYEGVDFSPASHGRSNSKSSSSSKSTSSSTGTGRGRGYGQGGSSSGHGTGHGGSSSGTGYGSGGHGSGYGSSGQGSGYGSGGHGSGYGSGGHGSGYGSGGHGSGYGSSGHGSGYGSSGHGSGYGSSGQGSGYGGSGEGYGSGGHYRGGQASYTPGGYEGGSNTQHYDDEGQDYPKIVTTTKSFTTNSAQNAGSHQYRQTPDSLGDINFRLGDYLKEAQGSEGSKYSQKLYEGLGGDFAGAIPGLRSGQGFNVNDFTRTINQGMAAGYNGPSYRNNRFVPQASFVYPRIYGVGNSAFNLGGF
ncbi:uncharacterized protein LOC129230669 [Uloborus diversus]|uniref:uncharacterized protein LOC129230669 n=1 Tax=Uloborus diversus TaxID=327109 RepID=UPI00240935BD|nr:uncharacterized protein LOC129230669 [Uloborus diversus]